MSKPGVSFVSLGWGGLLKSHKEREECRKSWNDFAADTNALDASVSNCGPRSSSCKAFTKPHIIIRMITEKGRAVAMAAYCPTYR